MRSFALTILAIYECLWEQALICILRKWMNKDFGNTAEKLIRLRPQAVRCSRPHVVACQFIGGNIIVYAFALRRRQSQIYIPLSFGAHITTRNHQRHSRIWTRTLPLLSLFPNIPEFVDVKHQTKRFLAFTTPQPPTNTISWRFA